VKIFIIKLSIKYKLFLSLIIFSFVWVIIGDLLSMHMRVIYHVDIQKHSPFTNIHKTVNKSNNSKCIKDFHFHSDFIIVNEFKLICSTQLCETIITLESKDYTQQNQKLYKGRAPPKFV
jgi:hypothetical protein